MSAIKIHLDAAELKAVQRLAGTWNLTAEDLAYAALNRLMLQAEDTTVRDDVLQTRAWRRDNLPIWSDSAGSVHAYESMPDEQSQPRKRLE